MFDLLTGDHRHVERMFEQLNMSFSQTWHSEAMNDTCRFLCQELNMHMRIEEKWFYPLLQKYEVFRALVESFYQEHSRLKSWINQIASMGFDCESQDVQRCLRYLELDFRHHIEQEERQIFMLAQRVIDESLLLEVEEQMQQMKDREFRLLSR